MRNREIEECFEFIDKCAPSVATATEAATVYKMEYERNAQVEPKRKYVPL